MITATGRTFLALGSVSAAIGVAAGAFGAHGLKNILSPDMLAIYEVAVRYQIYHALGIIASGVLELHGISRHIRSAGWLFLAGTILFSGSLYILTLTGIRWLGAVTPLGGVAFIGGWLVLAYAVMKR